MRDPLCVACLPLLLTERAQAALVIDRLGIWRALRLSLFFSALAAAALAGVGDLPGIHGAQHGCLCCAMPPADRRSTRPMVPPCAGLAGGLMCHFAAFIALEVAIVALLGASSLALPQAGGRAEALTVGGMGVGHVVGAFVALPLWRRGREGGGVIAYALFLAGASLLLVLASWLRGRRAAGLQQTGGSQEESATAQQAAPAEAAVDVSTCTGA